mmetsp:Transcript_7124/g.17875  ORF Transcript_7124/g.17875 Transcript_7124/m.17875 type:complete len:292 (+) Transcript_7124:309-1184(+)
MPQQDTGSHCRANQNCGGHPSPPLRGSGPPRGVLCGKGKSAIVLGTALPWLGYDAAPRLQARGAHNAIEVAEDRPLRLFAAHGLVVQDALGLETDRSAQRQGRRGLSLKMLQRVDVVFDGEDDEVCVFRQATQRLVLTPQPHLSPHIGGSADVFEETHAGGHTEPRRAVGRLVVGSGLQLLLADVSGPRVVQQQHAIEVLKHVVVPIVALRCQLGHEPVHGMLELRLKARDRRVVDTRHWQHVALHHVRAEAGQAGCEHVPLAGRVVFHLGFDRGASEVLHAPLHDVFLAH